MSKIYPNSALVGRAGVNLIERIVTGMGWVWNPTTIEAGIDGFIEIRDVVSGRGTNFVIQVQSKARTAFQRETAESVELTCDERDLDYWIGGNAPVILVLSRPDVGDAYWIDVKTYFKIAANRRSRIARFDKSNDRFDVQARDRLQALAVSKESGIYLGAPPRSERVQSNLVAVSAFATNVYTASTSCRDASAVRARLGWNSPDEWIARGGRLLSFCPLDTPAWSAIVDPATVEEHDTKEWAESTVADRTNEFRELLHRTLRSQLRPSGISYFKARDFFFFTAPQDLAVRRVQYRSFQKLASRKVFQPFSKKGADHVSYYRHAAFGGHFLGLEGRWFLAVVPTYHFTIDGWTQSKWYEEKLQGIKRLERNNAVLGQVAMWAAVLIGRPEGLFGGEPYLKFSALFSSELDAGINESSWLRNEEDELTKQAASDESLIPLLFHDEVDTR